MGIDSYYIQLDGDLELVSYPLVLCYKTLVSLLARLLDI